MKRKYFYIRVSTVGQNIARQIAFFEKEEGEKIVDKLSGTIPFEERPGGKKIIEAVKNGNVSELEVQDVDRLGRNFEDIIKTLGFMKYNNICVKITNLGLTSIVNGKKSSAFALMTSIMATFAQQNLESIKERQEEGIAAERKKDEKREFKDKAYKGRKLGSKNKDSLSLVEKYPDVKACLDSGMSIGKTVIATKICESTVKRVRKEYFKNKN
eukprot:TRINITY_DN7146_c0_g1_i1.p1 TRINITY_DN7146_c0_g1~~TRINITY_DN7146_c0_g1_i1.p1  ORF type:complete len:213 (+),score=17.78 TRINITY_DN7146_c0_g1_i1:1058-1696(+)